jgi:CBS domain-containing protein
MCVDPLATNTKSLAPSNLSSRPKLGMRQLMWMDNEARTVGEVVRGRPVYVVQRSDSVLDAARYMTQYQVGAVPVLAEGDLVGIMSERDVMIRVVMQELDPALTEVGEVMTREVAVLDEHCTYEDALAVMTQLHVRHLPVVAGKWLVGCVSLRELREAEIDAKGANIEFLDDYIEQMEKVS